MQDSVGHQVGGKPFGQASIAQGGRRGEPGADAQSPALHLWQPRLEHVADDGGQVNRTSQCEPALTLRQREQGVDQSFMLLTGYEYPFTGPFE